MTVDELRTFLYDQCVLAGGVRKWADSHDLAGETVRVFLRGDRPPGPKLLDALDMKVVVAYEKKRRD